MSAAAQSGWDVVSDEPTPAPQTQPQAQQGQDSGWDVASDEAQAPPEKSTVDFLLNRTPHSIYNAAQNIGHAALHPIETGEAMGNLIAGTFKAAARGVGVDMPENESDQVARASWEFLKNRYGGLDRVKESLYNDPVGTMMDLSTVLSGVGGVVRGAGAVADLAGAARAAETVGTVGRGLTKAAEVTNPAALATAPVGAVVKKLAPKRLPTFDPAFDPRTATFAGDPGAFDPSNATFEHVPPTTAPPAEDPVTRLRRQWKIKTPKGNFEEPAPPPEAQPPAPAPQPAKPSWQSGAVATAAGIATGAAAEMVTKHLLGSVGLGVLSSAAIKYLPMFLKSEMGQQMLSRIGPGSNAAAVASVARDMVPTLNAFGRKYQTSMSSHSAMDSLDGKARGGAVNPELARIQRERLRLPGIVETLQKRI